MLYNSKLFFREQLEWLLRVILNLQSAGLQRISRGVGIIFFRATLANELPGDPKLLCS